LLRDRARGEGISPAPGAQKRICRLHRRAERRFAAPAISEAEAAPATISARRDSYQGGNLIALPRTSFGSSTVKARIVGRDLEQHAVRLSKIGRTETAAVDPLGRAEPLRLEHGDHFGLRRVVGRAERDVVDATAALAADRHIGGGAHVHDVPRSPPARSRAGPPVTWWTPALALITSS